MAVRIAEVAKEFSINQSVSLVHVSRLLSKANALEDCSIHGTGGSSPKCLR
jgi:hypothetical protein